LGPVTDPDLRRHLSRAIIGDATFTVDELMSETSTARELADELWLNLGFPQRDTDDEKLYSQLDVEVLRSLNALLGLELADPAQLMAMARVMGQAMARLASAQVDVFDGVLDLLTSQEGDVVLDEEGRAAVTELFVPGVERFVVYCWRRHLLAAMNRALDGEGGVVIGFVDLVDFTKTTRSFDEAELAELVARFERHVYETVTNSGAQLRKSLGDGVMFDAPDAAVAASAALGLVMRCAEDPRLPGARGGLAAGPTVALEGDIYGATVNRASRLAALAYPNTVVADRELANTLHGQAGFLVRRLGSRTVKGLGAVDVSVIRRSLI